MASWPEHLRSPPNPADYTDRGTRVLLLSVYRWVQQNLNQVRIESGDELVPDRFPLAAEFIDAMAAHSNESISGIGQTLHLFSKNKSLEADEHYRRWFSRTRAKQLKEYRAHLARFAAEQKSKQASDRKQQAVSIAAEKRTKRPGRSNRAIAMDLAAKMGRSPETIRKYLTRQKPKTK